MMRLFTRYPLTMTRRSTACGLSVVMLAAVTVLLLSLPCSLYAADRMKGPDARSATHSRQEPPVSILAWFGSSAIRLYSEVISPADGPRSPSYPTSTAYGREAISRHGFFMGVLLTADRLIHESDIYHGPMIIKYGVPRYNDPVKYNTYWWEKP